MHLRRIAFLLLIGVTVVLAQNKKTTTEKPTTTVATTTKATTTKATTTKATTTKATTTKATTTAAQTTNATTAPPTNATTAPPTNATTAMPTNSTTAPPTNATTPAPTTTPVATTTPMPPQPVFVVNDSKGNACIMEQLYATFSIDYNKTEGNKTVVARITYPIPETSMVLQNMSMCGSTSTNTTNGTNPTITLSVDHMEPVDHFVQVFKMSGNSTYLQSITLSLNHTSQYFPNSTDLGKVVNYTGTFPDQTFMVERGSYFACNSAEFFSVDKNSNVTFSKMKVQTMGIVNDTFGTEKRCPQDTSTTPLATTSPSPSPSPAPPNANWTVRSANGSVCMLVNMSMAFQIMYNRTDGKQGIANVTLPMTASDAGSTCLKDSASFVLTFEKNWMLDLEFKMYSDSTYNNTKMSLFFVYDDNFSNATDAGKNQTVSTSKTNIQAAAGQYYSCMANTTIKVENVTFSMHTVQIQPFAGSADGKFGSASSCPADQGFNNIVPIAVGCALAALVIIVLVAYLIGRQRSSKSGYESV